MMKKKMMKHMRKKRMMMMMKKRMMMMMKKIKEYDYCYDYSCWLLMELVLLW